MMRISLRFKYDLNSPKYSIPPVTGSLKEEIGAVGRYIPERLLADSIDQTVYEEIVCNKRLLR
ncbi:MAG: hypothetical protein B6D72_06215 [gamma proteobacterium symbiont of Ctena orbiculata]|nr:MAG: hypothetical protein DBP00_03070 [gamma proteobacterium symbiont of Ctena orbiculata]PVV13167.1 MAG: hypothetical protein B6D72_06215 [gamma proteobacterium symbiont of Ctena orbiculata]PVV16127.1 MAG: hypothetical protein B6D82_01790 [gamma proteobacterium symbiont of Ctena orbiculata]PVV21808.1 MAG: hypothetical protein B6D74_11085 [gamma proteobacterium symbiont of Ctena orbiculata]